MPTGNMSDCKIGIMVDGEFQELVRNIGEITLAPEYEIVESFKAAGYKSESFSISFQAKDIDFRRIIRNATYGANNWRKLHGFPMIRKWKVRK